MSDPKAKGPYVPRVRVRLVRESRSKKLGPKVLSAQDVYNTCKELIDLDREHCVALHLDTKNRVIGMETVSVGHLASTSVHPREAYKAAILSNAASICLVHNHPSGECEPSREDMELTRRFMKVGEILGIPLIDHVVVARDGFCSLAERGIR